MGQSFKYTEPTIWALRKPVRQEAANESSSLYDHIYGYDPIRVTRNVLTEKGLEENIRKGSAENPELNILNPMTNFMVMELASDEPSKA